MSNFDIIQDNKRVTAKMQRPIPKKIVWLLKVILYVGEDPPNPPK